MTHAIDPAVVERAAEAMAPIWGLMNLYEGLDDERTVFVPLGMLRRARHMLASAIPEAVAQERELIKRAYLGLSVLRTMLKSADMMLGVQTTDELMTDMASLMPELPGTLALRARTTDQKGEGE